MLDFITEAKFFNISFIAPQPALIYLRRWGEKEKGKNCTVMVWRGAAGAGEKSLLQTVERKGGEGEQGMVCSARRIFFSEGKSFSFPSSGGG